MELYKNLCRRFAGNERNICLITWPIQKFSRVEISGTFRGIFVVYFELKTSTGILQHKSALFWYKICAVPVQKRYPVFV